MLEDARSATAASPAVSAERSGDSASYFPFQQEEEEEGLGGGDSSRGGEGGGPAAGLAVPSESAPTDGEGALGNRRPRVAGTGGSEKRAVWWAAGSPGLVRSDGGWDAPVGG